MCLDRIYKEKPAESGTGWKIVNNKGHKGLRSCIRGEILGTDTWIIAAHSTITYWPRETAPRYYKSGFHVYLTKQKLRVLPSPSELLVHVKFRKARLLGAQDGVDCVVADEIYISSKQATLKKQ